MVTADAAEPAPLAVNDDDAERVAIGDHVKVSFSDTKKTECYTLTKDKNDPVNGLLSPVSPLGKGMLGLTVDDEFEFEISGKTRRVMIMQIERRSGERISQAAA